MRQVGLRPPSVWSRHLGATGSPGTWRWGVNHLPPPQRPGATQGEGAADFAFAQGAARGALGGVLPQLGSPRGWGFLACPWPRIFLSTQLELASVSHSENFSLLLVLVRLLPAPAGEAWRKPWWVRSFFILFAFHIGKVKGQFGALGGWGV